MRRVHLIYEVPTHQCIHELQSRMLLIYHSRLCAKGNLVPEIKSKYLHISAYL